MSLASIVYPQALSNLRIIIFLLRPKGKNLLQLAVFSRYPIKEEHLIIYPDSKNCSLACDIEINGRTIRLFNNHLQTTEVSQNKRKLEKGLRTDDSQRVEHATLGLIDGLHENFRKRAGTSRSSQATDSRLPLSNSSLR